jgi:hypothetical protein
LYTERGILEPWNAGAKDRLENFLHVEVCARHVAVLDVHKAMAMDWVAAYRKYLGEPRPRKG